MKNESTKKSQSKSRSGDDEGTWAIDWLCS